MGEAQCRENLMRSINQRCSNTSCILIIHSVMSPCSAVVILLLLWRQDHSVSPSCLACRALLSWPPLMAMILKLYSLDGSKSSIRSLASCLDTFTSVCSPPAPPGRREKKKKSDDDDGEELRTSWEMRGVHLSSCSYSEKKKSNQNLWWRRQQSFSRDLFQKKKKKIQNTVKPVSTSSLNMAAASNRL